MKSKLGFSNLNKTYLSKELLAIDDKKDLLILAYGITEKSSISQFKQLWSKFDSSSKAVGRDEKNTKKVEGSEVGGAITLLDVNVDKKKEAVILAEMDMMNPIALNYHKKTCELFVGTARGIECLSKGTVTKVLQNQYFNSIHSIAQSKRGIYVVCTAIDTIIEIDPHNPEKTLWRWSAPEYGLNVSPKGELVEISSDIDYQSVGAIGSSHQATHINSVEVVDQNTLLATLFHQDQLIEVKKDTGKWRVVYDKLTNPHGIHKAPWGYIVSDTRGNRVVLLDKEYNEINTITGYFDWVQDSIAFGDYIIVANDNRGRLDIFDKDLKIFNQVYWNTDDRMISSLISIKAGDAKKIFNNI